MQISRVYERLVPEHSVWRDYLDLTKPGVTAVMLLSAVATMFIASEGLPEVTAVIALLVGGYMAVGGANVMNCCLDADLDAIMSRTAERPLAAQRLELKNAFTLGLALVALSFIILSLGVNLLSGLLAMAAVFIHVVVYTRWLKRRSTHNILVGAIPGAIAPLIGWAAASGYLSYQALIFFAIVFYWTPTHFWSLALSIRSEFIRAGIPTLPTIQGPQATRIQIGRYAVLMVTLSILPVGLGLLNNFYALAALLLGGFFVFLAASMMMSPGLRTTWRFYKYSSLYLTLLFAAMLVDWVFFF
jgi:heme o synthase